MPQFPAPAFIEFASLVAQHSRALVYCWSFPNAVKASRGRKFADVLETLSLLADIEVAEVVVAKAGEQLTRAETELAGALDANEDTAEASGGATASQDEHPHRQVAGLAKKVHDSGPVSAEFKTLADAGMASGKIHPRRTRSTDGARPNGTPILIVSVLSVFKVTVQ
ncbi:hypothetical protein K438DRAFT_1957188 [Mycena galopus ATCC 62051]|nr:hypothetical protein K438DRAFT_1957188 [Mycena galopus ATCC 62051]